jgi:hypothetical protein
MMPAVHASHSTMRQIVERLGCGPVMVELGT